MTKDQNKGITLISYNYLNLPVKIQFGSLKKIEYLYDATGKKVQKKITLTSATLGGASTVHKTDYLDGFQYYDDELQFFPTAEGYVRNTEDNGHHFNYVYNYTDHLGNVRLSYGFDTKDQELKVMEENNYYPFGLKHNNYNMLEKDYMQIINVIGIEEPGFKDGGVYDYKYNNKEFQDELGLNLYDYGARNYDAAIGRWINIDPFAETSRRFSPYTYALDNPVYFIDPDGMRAATAIYDWNANTNHGGNVDGIGLTWGNQADKNAYVTAVNSALGGNQQISFGDPLLGGNPNEIQLVATGNQNPLTEAEQAFTEEYAAAINSPYVAKMTAVQNDKNTVVGSFQTGKIDMADVAEFDKAGPGGASSAGVIAHETSEQIKKAEMGIKQGTMGATVRDASGNAISYPEFEIAHNSNAIPSENHVNGNIRGAGGNEELFLEKNLKITSQTVTPTRSGGITVTKVPLMARFF